MSKFFHPLMHNNFSRSDITSVKNFLDKSKILTSNKKVKEFEKKWSKWQGTKYSVFVNSGSSANLLSIAYLKTIFQSGEIIVPTLTWSSDVSSVINSGFKPVFVDIDLKNLGAIENEIIKKINKKTIAVFLTHVLGFNCLSLKLIKYLKSKKIILIEDCCESHGAKIYDKKVGTLSEGSTFSSYFGHHMTTVEGGFVSTDDTELHELMRAKRSHGLARECSDEVYKKYIKRYPDVDKRFMFITDGYNFRNNEFGAVLGLSQLPRLDDMIKRRREVCDKFVSILKKYDDIFHIPNFDGNSSFCLPFIAKDGYLRNDLQEHLEACGVETRPLCSGNLLRQPFLSEYEVFKEFPKVDYLHYHGFFIGNNHLVTDEEIEKLGFILDDYIRVL